MTSPLLLPPLPPLSQTSVPLRECLADVLADAHDASVDSPLRDVELDEIENVYDSLARSERIVGGYTRFGFEEKGAKLTFTTSDPDAVEESAAETPVASKPFGNPLFRAEGDLFERAARVGSSARRGASGGGGASFEIPSSRSRGPLPRPASSPSPFGPPGGVPSSARPSSAGSARRPGGARRPSSGGLPRRAFARPPSLTGWAPPRGEDFAGGGFFARDDSPSFRRYPSGPAEAEQLPPGDAALMEKIATVLREVRARVGDGDGDGYGDGYWSGGGARGGASGGLGPRFRAVSRDGRSAMKRRRAALMDALVRPAFATWRGAAASVAEDRAAAMMRRAAAAFANASRVAAFRRWLEFVGEARELRETLGRAAARFRDRSRASAWNRWCEFVDDRRAARRAAAFFAAREVAAAFRRWVEFVDETRELREVLARGMRFWVNGASARAFERWCAFCEEASEQRAAMERAAGRFRNATAGAAYARWEEYVADSKLARRAMRFFVHRELAGAFNRWAEFAEESREGKAVLAKAAKWWRERSLVAAWLRWRDVCVDAGVARWAATFFVKRAMGAAFNTWIARVEEAREMSAMLRRAAARFRLAAAAGAWARWREHVETIRVARRAASFFASRALRAAWARWLERVDEGHDRRAVFAKAAARFANAALCAAFAKWVEFAEEAQEQRLILRRALAFFSKRGLAKAWGRWLDHREHAAMARRALSHLNGSLVASAWRSWREAPVVSALLSRAIFHDAEAAGRRALARWREATLLSMLAEEQRRLAAEHFRVATLRKRWRDWIARVEHGRAVDVAAEHDARRLARGALEAWRLEMWVSHRRREGRALRALRAWRDAATRRRLARDLWDAADEHARRASLSRAFRAWSESWLDEARGALARGAIGAARLARMLRAWRRRAGRSASLLRVGAVAEARAKRRRLGRAFAALSHHWARKVLLRAFVYGRQKRTANEAWRSWEGHVSRARAARADRDKRDFSLARFPRSQAPWLAAGPGKKTRSPIASEKWKFY